MRTKKTDTTKTTEATVETKKTFTTAKNKKKAAETKKEEVVVAIVEEPVTTKKKRGRKKAVKETSAETIQPVETTASTATAEEPTTTKKARAKRTISAMKAALEKQAEATISLGEKLIHKMKHGVVRFTYVNRAGKEITTSGTLLKRKIPTTRVVAGAKKPKSKDMIVFYDTRHGVRRQFDRNKVLSFG